MLRSWKAFALVLMAALALVLLLPQQGSITRPSPVQASTEQITFVLDTDPEGGSNFELTVSGPSGCNLSAGDSNFVLNDNQSKTITCAGTPSGGTFTVAFDIPAGWATDTDTTTCDIAATVAATSLTLTLSNDQHVTCNLDFDSTGTPTATGTPATATPTATGTPQVSSLTVSVAPSTLGCTGSAFVTVVSKNAAGQAVAAGTVTLSTTLGTIAPTTAVDQGAGVLAVLTAPSNQSGIAVITAQAGGVSGQAQATITCAQATSTSVPPMQVPPTQAAPAGIQPPATGDAGLAAPSGPGSIALIALLLPSIGLFSSLVRRRVRT